MTTAADAIATELDIVHANIRQLEERKLQLEQAFALVTGNASAKPEPATPPLVTKERAIPKKPGAKPRYSRAGQKKPAYQPNRNAPWRPAPHAGSWSQPIYDLLANGKSFTSQEVLKTLRSDGVTCNLSQVTSTLSHMRATGRVMYGDHKWRRKYGRPNKASNGVAKESPTPVSPGGTPEQGLDASISAENVPLPLRSEVSERLDALAAEGKLQKTQQAGHTIYTLPKSAPSASKGGQ